MGQSQGDGCVEVGKEVKDPVGPFGDVAKLSGEGLCFLHGEAATAWMPGSVEQIKNLGDVGLRER
ncbi:MAG: hypothetical protein FJY85_07765, partial [Deltaproteobacteria bacterium]|nr:hypothetical protein [Deltaproteobacteria bacterium]